jgi:hypothetical protein
VTRQSDRKNDRQFPRQNHRRARNWAGGGAGHHKTFSGLGAFVEKLARGGTDIRSASAVLSCHGGRDGLRVARGDFYGGFPRHYVM